MLQALRYPSSYILYHILISISAQVSQLKIIHVKMFRKNRERQVNGSCLGLNVEPDHDRDAWLVQGQLTQMPIYSHRHEHGSSVAVSRNCVLDDEDA